MKLISIYWGGASLLIILILIFSISVISIMIGSSMKEKVDIKDVCAEGSTRTTAECYETETCEKYCEDWLMICKDKNLKKVRILEETCLK